MVSDYYAEALVKIRRHVKDKRWAKAQSLIHAELKLPYVPVAFATQLRSLLEITNEHLTPPPLKTMTATQILQLLSTPKLNTEAGIGLIQQLQQWNIKQLLPSVQKLLMSVDFNPLLKTHLCFLLKAQHVTTAVTICKADQILVVEPPRIESFTDNTNINQTMQILKDHITNYDVTIYDFALKILRCYFDFAFPRLDLTVQPVVAAATIYALAQKSLGISPDYKMLGEHFQVNFQQLDKIVNHWYPIMQQWD